VVQYDPAATNYIKASLKALQKDQSLETLNTVEANIAESLLKNADPNVREDETGETALFWALRERRSLLVKMLLQRGAIVTLKDRTGETPLHEAVNSDVETVEQLLKKGADINAVSNDGTSPLIAAAKVGEKEVVRRLLAVAGVKVSAGDSDSWTALHFAVNRGDSDIVTLLLEAGANVNATTSEGITPLKLAKDKGYPQIEEILVTAGAKDGSFCSLAISNMLQSCTVQCRQSTGGTYDSISHSRRCRTNSCAVKSR
jgi:ankyrin repeat protein